MTSFVDDPEGSFKQFLILDYDCQKAYPVLKSDQKTFGRNMTFLHLRSQISQSFFRLMTLTFSLEPSLRLEFVAESLDLHSLVSLLNR